MNRRMLLKWLGLGLGAGVGSLGFGGYAVAVEPNALRITRRTIASRTWPAGPALKIAALADFHAHPRCMGEAAMVDVVARTMAETPDLIVLLGDYGSQAPGAVPPKAIAEILRTLAAPLGVYAINGNHDWTDSKDAWRRGTGPTIFQKAFKDVGIPFLDNQAAKLPGTDKLWIVGFESEVARNVVSATRPGQRRVRGRLGRIEFLNRTVLAPVPDDATVILLAHEPDIFADALDPRVALTLCGHTHGGQIRIFGWSPYIPSQYGNRYAYGHIREHDRDLVISSGLGSHFIAGRPFRVGIPPEIVMLDVKRDESEFT